MKLYATVSSERATKGQGGKELEIIIYDGDRTEMARLIVVHREGGALIEYDYDEDRIEMERTKGEKQKGENRCNGVHVYGYNDKNELWCIKGDHPHLK